MKITIIENPRPLTIEHYNDVANAPLSASLNCGYASAISKYCDWKVKYLNFTNSSKTASQIANDIIIEKSDIILFHWVYSWGKEDITKQIISTLKKSSNNLIGTFGLFPTLSYDKLSNYCNDLDFVIVGEFEETLKELLTKFNKKSNFARIKGLYTKEQSLTKREKTFKLDTLPIPDDLGTNCNYNTLNISSSRGCFGDCSFCFINSYYGCRGRRERTIESFLDELDYRRSIRKIDKVYFIDPTFIGYGPKKKRRAIKISTQLKKRYLPFGFETRVDTIDQETITALAQNGADSIFLGIESGCDSILKRMNKNISTDDIRKAVTIVRDSGVQLSAGFIMFEPNSTLDELRINFNFLEELDLMNFHDQTVNMLYHNQIVLYGSKSWNDLKKNNRLIFNSDFPFEARFKFKDPLVALICSSMKKIALQYFINIDKFWKSHKVTFYEKFNNCHIQSPKGLNEKAINKCLKESFKLLLKNVTLISLKEYRDLEKQQIEILQSLFLM